MRPGVVAVVTGLCAACVLGLAAPWGVIGVLWPLALGAFLAVLFLPRSRVVGVVAVVTLVVLVSLIRLCGEAIILDGGDFSFDHERGLEAFGIGIHLVLSLLAFFVASTVFRRNTPEDLTNRSSQPVTGEKISK